MKELFQKIIETNQQKQPVALATVITGKGSLPMSKRAKMLVFQDGSIQGTVGGGILEAQVIEDAQQVLASGLSKIVAVDLTSEQIESDGLTCGGTVEILIECFTSKSNPDVLWEIIRTVSTSESAVLATLIPATELLSTSPGKSLGSQKVIICADGTLVGTFGSDLLDAKIRELAQPYLGHALLKTFSLDLSAEERKALGLAPGVEALRVFLETLLPTPTAYLFGGGHVSTHLAKILHFIGFEYVVVDDRHEFLTRARFPYAKEFIEHEFANVLDALTLIPNASYLVIVTRGHKSDLVVLKQAFEADVKYIGMIGSSRKIQLLFEELQEQGIPKSTLDTIHAPIGLEIDADTPEEIAISIAAELIQIRRHGE